MNRSPGWIFTPCLRTWAFLSPGSLRWVWCNRAVSAHKAGCDSNGRENADFWRSCRGGNHMQIRPCRLRKIIMGTIKIPCLSSTRFSRLKLFLLIVHGLLLSAKTRQSPTVIWKSIQNAKICLCLINHKIWRALSLFLPTLMHRYTALTQKYRLPVRVVGIFNWDGFVNVS